MSRPLAHNPETYTDACVSAQGVCVAQEYMRKLGKCLLSIQQDERAGARPLLNLWVAEAIALICCVRVYNPEFLKAIDSAAMNGSAAVRPSHGLLIQHLVSVCTLLLLYLSDLASLLHFCNLQQKP